MKAENITYRDSLHALLSTQLDGKDRVDILKRLYDNYRGDHPDSAVIFLQEALAVSQEINDVSRQINSCLSLAYYYFWIKGTPSEAKMYLSLAQPLLDASTKPRYVSAYYLYSGIIHMDIGIYDTAAAHFLVAQSLFEDSGNEKQAMNCISNLGTVYKRMGQYDQALDSYLHYLEKAEARVDEDGKQALGLGLGNIGSVYKSKKDYPKAIHYLQRSLKINKELGNQTDMLVNYQNLGSMYEAKESLDSAEYYYTQALKLAEDLDLPMKMLRAQHGLGAVYTSQKQYKRALPLLESALVGAIELDARELIAGINLSLSRLHAQTGDLSQALAYRITYEVWKDSIMSISHLNQVKELDLRYETTKKEKEISFLTQQTRIQDLQARRQTILNQSLGGGIILVLIIAGLLIFQARQRLRNQKLFAAQQKELDRTHFQQKVGELEMKALRAQMNPHFVFNCLNSINHLTLKGDTKQASRYLSKFSKLLRQILEHSEKDLVPLAEELSMLNTYIQLEALRFKDKIHVETIIDPDTDVNDIFIPPLILQPIVENAIWHGLMHKEGAGNIWISVKEESDQLICVIEDDGIGREKAVQFRPESSLKNKSMGLQLSRERLHLLAQEEENAGEMRISDRVGGGTRVDIRIPIQ